MEERLSLLLSLAIFSFFGGEIRFQYREDFYYEMYIFMKMYHIV